MTLLPDNERLKIMLGHAFGYMVLFATVSIAVVIVIRKVEPTSSYGLEIVLGALAAFGGGYTNWAFSQRKESDGRAQQ
jgi:predicted anti-sigma-YlaC factor YlaD